MREITDQLDAVGNTTAAIGKGFAIGSARTALASFRLFASSRSGGIDINTASVIAGLFIGGMLVFLYFADHGGVGSAAFFLIEEIRRQFRRFRLDGGQRS